MKKYDCIIVGAGPAGIFCALELVRQKKGLNILILDKGQDLKDRKCPSREKNAPCFGCASCAVISGWGGAGATITKLRGFLEGCLHVFSPVTADPASPEMSTTS